MCQIPLLAFTHDATGMVLFIVLGATAALITMSVVAAVQWRKQRDSQTAANLIHDMLAHNLPTDEIERLMNLWSKEKLNIGIYLKTKSADTGQTEQVKGKAEWPA